MAPNFAIIQFRGMTASILRPRDAIRTIGGPYLEECGSGSVFGITEPDKLWLRTEMYFDCPKCGHSARINNVGKTSFQGNPSSFRNTPCSKCGHAFDAGPGVKFGQCPGFDYSKL